MSNVLSEETRQQVIALGRLGWSLRRIEKETGVRRETAGAYLKAAGIEIGASGGWGRRKAKPANGAKEASPDPQANPGDPDPKPANEANEASPGPDTSSPPITAPPPPGPTPTASACEVHRDFIELSLGKGRNAKAIYQD